MSSYENTNSQRIRRILFILVILAVIALIIGILNSLIEVFINLLLVRLVV